MNKDAVTRIVFYGVPIVMLSLVFIKNVTDIAAGLIIAFSIIYPSTICVGMIIGLVRYHLKADGEMKKEARKNILIYVLVIPLFLGLLVLMSSVEGFDLVWILTPVIVVLGVLDFLCVAPEWYENRVQAQIKLNMN